LDREVSLFFCMAGICPQQSTSYQGSYRAFSSNDVHGSPVVIVTSGGQLHGFRCPYGFLARLAVDVVDAQGRCGKNGVNELGPFCLIFDCPREAFTIDFNFMDGR